MIGISETLTITSCWIEGVNECTHSSSSPLKQVISEITHVSPKTKLERLSSLRNYWLTVRKVFLKSGQKFILPKNEARESRKQIAKF